MHSLPNHLTSAIQFNLRSLEQSRACMCGNRRISAYMYAAGCTGCACICARWAAPKLFVIYTHLLIKVRS